MTDAVSIGLRLPLPLEMRKSSRLSSIARVCALRSPSRPSTSRRCQVAVQGDENDWDVSMGCYERNQVRLFNSSESDRMSLTFLIDACIIIRSRERLRRSILSTRRLGKDNLASLSVYIFAKFHSLQLDYNQHTKQNRCEF